MERKPRLMFNYPGSKGRLAPDFVKLFPQHKIYVSPFVGTASEFVHKQPSAKEVINDLDDNVYSVFAVMREPRSFNELHYRLRNSLDSRRLYDESHERLRSDKDLSVIDRAYHFLIISNFGYQGVHPLTTHSYSCGITKRSKKLDSLLAALIAWRNRMRSVICEHLDALEVIRRYDSVDTFFYLDPPYHLSTRNKNLYVHDDLNQRMFVKCIQTVKGKAFICGYDNGLYDVQLQGWRKIVIPTSKSIGGRAPRNEIVWMNYDATGRKLDQDLDLIQAFENLQP